MQRTFRSGRAFQGFVLMVFVLLSAGWGLAQEEIDPLMAEGGGGGISKDFTMRVRVTRLTPSEPSDITWRHSGEGFGGTVYHGTFGEKLAVGQWTQPAEVASLKQGKFDQRLYLTIEAGRRPRRGAQRGHTEAATAGLDYSTDVEFEIEFSYQGQVLKTIKELGPQGGNVTIILPANLLSTSITPASPEFLNELIGIQEYATRRMKMLQGLPWASWPVPKKFMVVADLKGYGTGIGRGIRHTNLTILEAEARSVHQLGANAIRNPDQVIVQMVASGQGFGKEFHRGFISTSMNYPVVKFKEGRPDTPATGCPFHPGVAKLSEEGVAEALEVLKLPVPEVWALTIDEIGVVYARTASDGNRHLVHCTACQEGFRQYLRQMNLSPAEFGKKDWSEVVPLDIFGPKKAPKADKKKGPPPPAADARAGKKGAGKKSGPKTDAAPADDKPWSMPNLDDPAAGLTAYYTMMFTNYASARLFTPLVQAYEKANQAKREAPAKGLNDSPAARQPFAYSYALRGNTFLMGGGPLDFFNFYRLADNGFMYETSNRGPQVWSWDSYLCDVGRIVTEKMNKPFGIDLKPHRGAPVQRALSTVSRGVRVIYWYTYGPDYAKGDSFSQSPEALTLTSKAAHLIGKCEDVLWDSTWAKPAEVAVVKPDTMQIWMRMQNRPEQLAAWENAKWIYTALAHAHIPVDPLDEVMLASEDLSKYKIIYINGTNLRRDAAAVLEKYVKAGGVLYSSGYGLARDEANQPLKALNPVFGLEERNSPEMYYTVRLYGAAELERYDDPRSQIAPVPEGAALVALSTVQGAPAFAGAFKPVIGREILRPAGNTQVLVKFADGSPAVTRHAHGKGKAYVAGFFPGLEYSAQVRGSGFDMSRDFDAGKRSYVAAPALGLVQPVVEPAVPTVEAVLLKNKTSGKQAVTVMNWAYRTSGKQNARGKAVVEIVPLENLKITIRGTGEVKKVTSGMLDQQLDIRSSGDSITVTLPHLEEGDVLLLD